MRPKFFSLALAVCIMIAAAPNAPGGPINVLIITGDNIDVHGWKETTKAFEQFLESPGKVHVTVSTTPATDLTDARLAEFDVLLLNYKETPKGGENTKWSEANKNAFLAAVRGGKGLVVTHYASAAFSKPENWKEFETAIAGGWRTQGFHGPKHEFIVKATDAKHPISIGAPANFAHPTDELYQNSLLPPGSVVLATAYSDPQKPKGTGKDEAMIWVNQYGKGRVLNCVLGHDATAMADPNYQAWIRRGVEWAATGDVASTAK